MPYHPSKARASSAVPALLLALLLSGCGDDRGAPSRPDPATNGTAAVDRRIDFHRRQLAADPMLYPVLALLAEAHLDRAKITRDVADVGAAVEAARKSLEIQPTYAGYLVAAAIANFRHRFTEAIELARKAAAAAPADEGTEYAMLVEALIGAGRTDEAAQMLEDDTSAVEFHRLTAMARVEFELEHDDIAFENWMKAVAVAREKKVDSLAGWALIRAAAVRIDGDRPREAASLLDEAARLMPEDADLVTHRAELAAATGDTTKALAMLESLLERSKDPFAAVAAAGLARALGRSARAAELEAFAEPILREALDRGEVYTLGALARLEEGRCRWNAATEFARRHASTVADRGSKRQLRRITAAADAPTDR